MTTDYSKMSDFGINKRVLEIKSGLKALNYAHNADKRSAGVVDINDNYHWFDFCNSWADAGPIIEKNQISLDAIYEGGPRWLSFAGEDSEFRQTDKNPLRTAMIVFLMMQEGDKNE